MRRNNPLLVSALAALLGGDVASAAPPTLITPNGLGTTVAPPAAGIYNISGGTTAGNNLFHSFSNFNLGTGNTADFNVSGNITNILARVTGGPSTVDGTITSTLGAGGPLSSANLFFINPAGILFTANAQVNLGGSFIASTASYVKFSDGSSFYGDLNHPIQDAGLTMAPVSAFGFLTPTPQPVSFTGSQITMQANTGLHVIAGDITVDQGSPNGVAEQGANLAAPSGALTLFSAASAGEVPFSLASPGSGYATAPFSALGNITVQNQSSAFIDGVGGGNMVIRGGKITVDNSFVTSGNTGAVAGGNISVQADQLSVTGGGFIATDCEPGATGNAGSISLNVAGALEVAGAGSQISANTDSAGNGGDIGITAGSIDLNGGDIFSVPNAGTSGNGGNVTVNAGSMSMEGNSRVSTFTAGTGDAGTVNLTLASSLSMTDTSAIVADTYSPGNGGNVNITAAQVNLSGQALISANTAKLFPTIPASANGGNVTIQAGSLSIQGTGSEPPNSLGITALTESDSTGDAGVISVTAGTLSLNGGAIISSSSLSLGEGGSVSVNTAQGTLSGQSSISAASELTTAGSVQVTASDSFSLLSGSSISTSAANDGGDINLKIGRMLYLLDSEIVAYAGVVSVPGQQVGGSGGNINIDPEFVVLNNSLISANDLSGLGQNGNITNSAEFFFTNDSLLHATGTIQTTPPDLDLAGSLVFLPGNLVSAETQLRERCERALNHEYSTFIVVGRGGIETAPEELQSDFGLDLSLPPSGGGELKR